MMHMEPRRNYTPDKKCYNSPLYIKSARAGVLSITGNMSEWDVCACVCEHISGHIF